MQKERIKVLDNQSAKLLKHLKSSDFFEVETFPIAKFDISGSKIVDGKKKSTGRFAKGSYKTIGFLLQKSIFKKGIKATMFFTKPFEVAFKRYKKEINKTLMQDIIDSINLNNEQN